MAYEKLAILDDDPLKTLKAWSRKLEYITNVINTDILGVNQHYIANRTAGQGRLDYSLPIPNEGLRFSAACLAGNSSDFVALYTGSTAIFIGPGTGLYCRLTAPGQTVQLMGVSTSRWSVLSLGSTTVTTTLPTITT